MSQGSDRPLVCQGQPLGELTRRLVGRLPVEGHHGGWHPGNAPELRAPAVGDGRDLNLVRATADSLFESMNRHVCMSEWETRILRSRLERSSEAGREGACTRVTAR